MLLKACDHDVRAKQMIETSTISHGVERDLLLIRNIEADLRKIQMEVGEFMKLNLQKNPDDTLTFVLSLINDNLLIR